MKSQPLEALMADPSFDPTLWMLEAFKHYIESKPGIVLQDPTSRPYLLDAMDGDWDWRKLINHLPPEREIIVDVIDGMKRCDLDKETHKRFIRRLADLEEKHPNQVATLLAGFSGLKFPPKDSLLDRYSSAEILEGIKVWDHEHWGQLYWGKTIDRLNDNDLIKLLNWDKFPAVMMHPRTPRYDTDDSKVRGWQQRVIRFQDTMVKILRRLPHHVFPDFERMLVRIKSEDLKKFYSSSRKKNKLVPDRRITRDVYEKDSWYRSRDTVTFDPKLNELMCRCGYMCASSSGLALHRKECKHGKAMTLHKVVEMHKAVNGLGTDLTCDRCGKVCKSKPGYTLHRKKCKMTYSSDELYRLCIS